MPYSTRKPRPPKGPCAECGGRPIRSRGLCDPCYQRAIKRERRLRTPHPFPPRPCDYCGKVIEKPRRADVRYCSRKCSYRWRNRYYLYGIGDKEVAAMLESQGHRCAICRSGSPKGKRDVWHVDHDHDTGAVRGILCHHCNLGIGYLSDDVDRLRAAVVYLEAHAERMGATQLALRV